MKLIYESTGKEAKVGDVVKVKDKFYFLKEIIPPYHRCSLGRVILRPLDISKSKYKGMFMPEEIGAVFIPEE